MLFVVYEIGKSYAYSKSGKIMTPHATNTNDKQRHKQ